MTVALPMLNFTATWYFYKAERALLFCIQLTPMRLHPLITCLVNSSSWREVWAKREDGFVSIKLALAICQSYGWLTSLECCINYLPRWHNKTSDKSNLRKYCFCPQITGVIHEEIAAAGAWDVRPCHICKLRERGTGVLSLTFSFLLSPGTQPRGWNISYLDRSFCCN